MKHAAPLCAILLAACAASEEPQGKSDSGFQPRYDWKAKTIYRFQYQKRIEVTRGAGDARRMRQTEFNGVLVFEVERVEAGEAQAVMRFDNPNVRLAGHAPKAGGGEEDPVLAIERAIDETLRDDTRWRVQLGAQGRVRILSRTPASLEEWLSKVKTKAAWRRKAIQDLHRFLEQDLRLNAGALDEQLLFCPGPASEDAGATGLFAALTPQRSLAAPRELTEGRVECATRRLLPSTAGQAAPIVVPYLDPAEPPVRIFPGKLENLAGRAVFDAEWGLLDEAVETYQSGMRLVVADDLSALESEQTVKVDYRLKRLAPPLRGPPDPAAAR